MDQGVLDLGHPEEVIFRAQGSDYHKKIVYGGGDGSVDRVLDIKYGDQSSVPRLAGIGELGIPSETPP